MSKNPSKHSGFHRKAQGYLRSWPEMGCHQDGNQRFHDAVLYKRRARLENDKENQLLICCSSRNDPNLLNEYYTLKAKLEKYRTKKIKGTILRSKARWYENGRKYSKYFLNLEKRNFLRKIMSS